MDRFTRTADIIKAYYSYKQTADSATFVKKVCSFFDFIKDESLSDADLNLLLFLANEAGIPQYYDLLKSKFTNAEIGDESINSLTMSALFHDASLIRGDSKLHRYQKHVLDSFVAKPLCFNCTYILWKNFLGLRDYPKDAISECTFDLSCNKPIIRKLCSPL